MKKNILKLVLLAPIFLYASAASGPKAHLDAPVPFPCFPCLTT